MLDKVKDQRLITLIILVFLVLQFMLAYTDHQQLNADVISTRASLASCQSFVTRPH